jgi:hypothetical protein
VAISRDGMSQIAAFFGRFTPARRHLVETGAVLGLIAAIVAALVVGSGHAPRGRHAGSGLKVTRSATSQGAGSSTTTSTTAPSVPSTTGTSAPAPTSTTAPRATTTTSTARAPQPTSASTPTSGAAAALARTPFRPGAYNGAANPSGLAAFDAATGSSSQIASDYLPSNSGWSGMDGAGGTLSWLTRAWAGSGYTLSLGVPIIPTNSSGAAEGSLATGATGAYNGYFVTLAQTLVAAGESNAFLRLGWEFDYVGGYPWTVANGAEAASYSAYFDQIVTAMRSVPGENFSFVWNPDAGAFIESGYDVALSYPGNAYVNVIGIDAYDESWASPHTASTAWAVTTLPALSAARAFAAAEGKPLAVCEWGVAFAGQGLGDDPLYVNNMAAWMHNSANDVLYESYFNYNGSSDSALTSGKAPASLAAFRADFG